MRERPVTRSRKRTEPSRPPASSVRPSGLRAAADEPTRSRFSGRSVRASRITVGPSSKLVTTRRPSRVDQQRGLVAGGAGDEHRLAERTAAARVEALDEVPPRVDVDDGEQRAPVRREAQTVDDVLDVPSLSVHALRARVEDERLAASGREPRAVVAEAQVHPSRWGPGTACGRASGRSVRASSRRSVPSVSTNASVRSSGLRATLVIPSPSPRSTAIAAGLSSSVASRLLRVCERVVERQALAGEQERAVELPLRRAPGRRGPAPLPRWPRRAPCRAGPARRGRRSPPAPAATPRPRARSAAAAGRARSPSGPRPGTRARWRSARPRGRPPTRAPRRGARRGRARRGRDRRRPRRARTR